MRGFDVRTGKRLWIFHTVPARGEFGYETWGDGAAERNGNTGVWSQMSADPELGLVYLPVEMPSSDYNGFNRPGDGLFGESLVALDVRTGQRRWHYQTVHHGLWDFDLPSAPILFDMQQGGRTIKALAQPTKQAFLFVLNRETGEPIWPIEERPVPQSESPFEKTSPTQPFPTRPQPFDRQGFSADVLNDLTPALRAEAERVMAQYHIGPSVHAGGDRSSGRPARHAHAAGRCRRRQLARRQLRSRDEPPLHSLAYGGLHAAEHPRQSHSRSTRVRLRAQAPLRWRPPRRRRRRAVASVRGPAHWERNRGREVLGASTFLQGTIPLIKPPYDRITAYDMNTGEMLWQKAHSTTPDNIRNNPALAGLDVSRLGAYGRIFIGTLTTKTLVIAGEGDVHTDASGETVALLRAYDKETGEDVAGQVRMPAKQTGSPMTYLHNGKQYIVVAVSQSGVNAGAELIAYALP